MDFAALEYDEVIKHTIVGKDGAPTECVFDLAGPGHPVRVELERKALSRTLRQFNKQGKATIPDDPDELRDQETDRMVALTLGWSGVDTAFSPNAARAIYENRHSSVRSQISKALADIANFTTDSSRA